jgi:anti-anti-sigma factor
VVSPVGEIEFTTAAALERALDAAVRARGREIWIDLTRVTFMDVAGLHLLLGVQCALDREHRRLGIVVSPDGVVRRLIEAGDAAHTLAIQCDRRREPRAG